AIPAGNLLDISMDTWRKAWELKVFGYIALTRHFLKSMSDAGDGVIVNVIGSAGEIPDFDYVCGSTGNAALMAFTHSCRRSSFTTTAIAWCIPRMPAGS
uniref:SDR family NAD(P)-dependent oxidoreductase n=1 Tax=uncultured Paracoccus sp. TaxID=189685 RepID=UPI00261A6C87